LYNRPVPNDKEQSEQWTLSDKRHFIKPIAKDSLVIEDTNALKTKKSTKRTKSKAVEDEVTDVSSEFKARGGTLIVLPTIAIRQWQTEIARFTLEGSLTVQVYHGVDRNTTIDELLKTDVVITSYKVSYFISNLFV